MGADAGTGLGLMSLFADNAESAARTHAVDLLHSKTAIYTAETVVDELLARLDWPYAHQRLVDPSCGDGMVLGRALAMILEKHSVSDELLPQLVQGWEIHHFACSQARARVEAVLIAHGRSAATAARLAALIVHNRDFLIEGPSVPTWDIIVGNPPYLRWLNVPELLRGDYVSHVPGYAVADLLHCFLDRCARTLRADGQIAFVTSDRWLFNRGAAKLRAVLGKQLSIRHLERLDAKTAFYRPKQRVAGSPPRIHPVAVVLDARGGQSLSSEPIYPGVDECRYMGLPTLQEIAEVRLAPWLGTSGVFVMTWDDARRASIPDEYLVPAVDTDDVKDGYLGVPTRCAIRTQPRIRPSQSVIEHLQKQMPRMAPRGRRHQWLPPETFHRLDLSKPSLLVPRIATSPRAVWIPPGVLPINHNLSIVTSDVATLRRVERALRGELAAEWVRAHAAPLENGYRSLTTTLLRKLPIDQ